MSMCCGTRLVRGGSPRRVNVNEEQGLLGRGRSLKTPADREEQQEAGLVELHEDVAETIIRAEELVLSKKDEVGTVLPVGAVDV